MRYPRNLKKGDYIGVTAPSSGKIVKTRQCKKQFRKNRI